MKILKYIIAMAAGAAGTILVFRPRKSATPLNANQVSYVVSTPMSETVLAVGIGEHGSYVTDRVERRANRSYEELLHAEPFLNCDSIVVTDGALVLYAGNA